MKTVVTVLSVATLVLMAAAIVLLRTNDSARKRTAWVLLWLGIVAALVNSGILVFGL
ncbi:hypothetical protein GCM10012275_42500 [Longimycelium tulufanense]|uniref:Uncharacterized protein n=1 Tax=Longimycelium tulufanense TaxID=907463 RepID=A0A8J3CAY3_9PSEU|nr:hypothetical protein [Longimycelium tulufanense]GGM67402.1 hypothetical protein GCM10012275_42500 [Longimycelium tulufanense]